MIRFFLEIEPDILLWIQNNMQNDILTIIFKVITYMGNYGAIWIAISFMLLIPKKTRKIGILALFAMALSVIIDNVILKNLIGRLRPYEVINGLNCLIAMPTDYSFPSGHAGSSFAAAMILFQGLQKKYGVLAVVFAAMVSFSRLYVGVHYPSDVICGAVIGCLIAFIVYTVGINFWDNEEE